MAVIVSGPPALSGDLALFHTTDPLLSNSPVLVFHGPATTIGPTSSRIQVHVFTPAGIGSYARLSVSPNSQHYSAVSNLPREEQGDEVIRGLAFGLRKYFTELPEGVKKIWSSEAKAPPSSLFGDDHIAILASRMARVENADEVIGELQQAFQQQQLSWLDLDVVLPPGSISTPSEDDDSRQYGKYSEVVNCFGETSFIPSSKLRRAPSKPIGRSTSFLKQHKEIVQKEICELLDTEESYADRVRELQKIADDVATETTLRDIFPGCIHEIVRLQSEFLASLRTIFDEIEKSSPGDMEATIDALVSGIAKCLCEWLPKFKDVYGDYLKRHSESTQLLRNALKSGSSNRLQEYGEQQLTSLLIEPVQRLPRYTLYIDSMTKHIPADHPAMKPLLVARDVVRDICDGDDSTIAAAVSDKLRSRISGWPDTQITGRLVTAADYVELLPPYTSECDGDSGMILLFTDAIVFLEKCGSAVSARTFLTDIESGRQTITSLEHLKFLRHVKLDDVACSEFPGGEKLQVMTGDFIQSQIHVPEGPNGSDGVASKPPMIRTASNIGATTCQLLRLLGSYERKAERLAEEIMKARVEARFSEAERDSHKWEVRASDPTADTARLFCAVFEDSNQEHVAARSTGAPIRVLIDIDKHSRRPRAGQHGLRTVVSISPLRDSLWRLTIDSVNGNIGREHVALSELVSMLRKKLSAIVAAQFGVDQPAMTNCLLSKNADILHSVNLQFPIGEESASPTRPERVHRPMSPKKLLSSFLSSTGPGSQPPAFLKKELPPLPPPTEPASSFSSYSTTSKPPSRESRPTSKDQPTPRSLSSMQSTEQLNSPHKKLEDTLSTYILALQARKGNIVGRNLKMRAMAEELAVNELYNSVLEDSNMMVLAAQAPVDVLFAAFEKFLNIAWKETFGQILPYAVMQDVQHAAETLFPADFDKHFKSAIQALPPQNQRAFKGIMNLLADLLDGTGNDGDRGILTAAFAEVLITEGNPHDYIALIDRFVDDPDTYFGEPLEETQKATDDAFNPHKRARSVNSASISSNTSSLRRKFGFGMLTRENSKSEPESKVASVWRQLSKSTRGDPSPASSISKGTLHRAHSTDAGMLQRPSSQGSPSAQKSLDFGEEGSNSAMSSVHNLALSTIGEHPSFIPTQPPRKKRRSSLSDLKSLEVSQQLSPMSSPASRLPAITQRKVEDKSLPNSPMASTPSSKGGSGRFGSPTRETPRSRLPSSFRKENSPGLSRTYSTAQRPKSSSGQPDEVLITARPKSSIPALTPKTTSPQKAASPTPARTGLAERPGAGNIIKKPSPQPDKTSRPVPSGVNENGSPKKLRMQSPQKLRERLQNEQSAAAAIHESLQDELTKIGDELTSTPSRIGSVRKSTTSGIRADNMELAQRVLKMEGQVQKQSEDVTERLSKIQSDLASSLSVSEAKCKRLDELYREANSENEALYARFNDELGRILKAVKGGEGVEELKKKAKEKDEENAKLKRELGRLKRENAGLRAQLKE